MSEQWRTDLERLRECYPDLPALARAIGVEVSRLRQVANGVNRASENVKAALREHRETLQEEHVVAKEIGHYALQMIQGYRDGGYTDEQLARMEETLQEKIDKLCD
jgi:hypothetical protein